MRNVNLIRKAADDDRRRAADAALRRSRRADPVSQVRSFLTDGATPTGLPTAIRQGLAEPPTRLPLRRLLAACVGRSDLVASRAHAAGLVTVARWSDRWLRQPDDWSPASHNRDRQFASLVRFLLARYPVPAVLDEAWVHPPGAGRSTEQGWFVHVGAGGNLRKADGLPFPLTKMSAHHALSAPVGTGVRRAVVWGWWRAEGAGERLATALVAADPIGRLGDGRAGADDRLTFWGSVVRFFAGHDRMLDLGQVPPMVDFIEAQK